MNMNHALALALILLALSRDVNAQGEPEIFDDEWPGWIVGLGYVIAPDPFVGDADDASQPIPIIGYVGERLTWFGPYLGYEILGDELWTLTAVAEVRFEGFDSDSQSPQLMGLNKRKSAIETGVDLDLGPFSLAARVDVSGRHEGESLSLAYSQGIQLSEQYSLEGTLGADWQSSEIVDYYYGVSAAETTAMRSAYLPGSALNYFADVQLTYQFNDRTLLFAGVEATHLDNSIASSPIVADKRQWSGQIGFVYQLFK